MLLDPNRRHELLRYRETDRLRFIGLYVTSEHFQISLSLWRTPGFRHPHRIYRRRAGGAEVPFRSMRTRSTRAGAEGLVVPETVILMVRLSPPSGREHRNSSRRCMLRLAKGQSYQERLWHKQSSLLKPPCKPPCPSLG
jgi:hypothetical protein